MKKLRFSLIALLGIAGFGQAFGQDAPVNYSPATITMREYERAECAGFTAGSELLLFTLYAKQGAGGNQNLGNIDDYFPEYESVPGGRYWIGYEMADGLGLRGRYFHWSDDERYNNVVREQEFETADLEATLDTNLWSLDLTGFAGVRYGNVELDGSDFGERNEYNFEGAGLTIGVDARRCLFRSLNLVGGLRYSVLYGEVDFDTTAASLDNVYLDIIEARIGTEWSKNLASGARLFAAIGWEQQIWGTDSYLPNQIDPETLGDVSLAGPTFSIGFDR